jgi:hypothetical protein
LLAISSIWVSNCFAKLDNAPLKAEVREAKPAPNWPALEFIPVIVPSLFFTPIPDVKFLKAATRCFTSFPFPNKFSTCLA